jgi:hypothetical protein
MGFLRYYGAVFRVAFTHSLSIAQAVIFALVILIGGIAYFFPKTQTILTAWASALNGWQVATGVLGSIIFVRLALAPYWISKQDAQTIDALNRRLSNPVPDIIIETRTAAEIIQREEGGFHVIIKDFHVTNRDGRPISLEARFRFDFGGGFAMSPNHDDVAPEFMELGRQHDPTIGKHWPRRIALSAYEGGNGYLSYTVPNYDGSPLVAMSNLSRTDAASLLAGAEYNLEITEHVSGVTKTIPVRAFGNYSFRDMAID